jgi:integrase
MSRHNTLKLLNKLTVTELAELSDLSKSYISQVKHGKCPPSRKLIESLEKAKHNGKCESTNWQTALQLFLKYRREGISPNNLGDHRITLCKSLDILGLTPSSRTINRFLNTLPCSLGGKYGYYKDLRAFYNWLYSPRSGFNLKTEDNPITWVEAPKRPQYILPSLTKDQVLRLIEIVDNIRDKAIIALFVESGLRLSELTNIKPKDIDWDNHMIKTLGKGRKEAYAPFGELSEGYLKQWLAQNESNGNIWGINAWGISIMLRRLKDKTELPCNPHTLSVEHLPVYYVKLGLIP